MIKTKRKRMKKWLIIILIIALVIGFIPVWNSGLGLPFGYKPASGPRDDYGKLWGEINHPLYFYVDYGSYSTNKSVRDNTGWIPYFYDENKDVKCFFDYNNERYYMQNLDSEVYKEADNTLVGSFITKEKDWIYNCYQKHTIVFFDDHYIYYIFTTRIYRFSFDIPTHPRALERAYRKYRFYRLNLDNGQNEKIDVDLFVEKINKYDETIKKK